MIVTDAQIHIWGPNVLERPWKPGQSTPGTPDEPFEAPRILAEMDTAGVDRAILVPHGERNGLDPARVNDLGLAAAAQWPDRFAVMGVISSFDTPAAVDLEHWLDQPGMLGVRISNRQSSTGILTDGRVDWLFEGASNYDIPVMLYAPNRMEAVRDLATRYPRTRILLDHLNISAPRGSDISQGIEDIISLAQYPNIAAKISALPRLVEEPWPYPSLHPYVERVINAYGADRCIWGSDLSGLGVTYRDWVRAVTEGMSFLTTEQKELVMNGALSGWLNWPAN